jgi:hypothetical protein
MREETRFWSFWVEGCWSKESWILGLRETLNDLMSRYLGLFCGEVEATLFSVCLFEIKRATSSDAGFELKLPSNILMVEVLTSLQLMLWIAALVDSQDAPGLALTA